MKLNAVAVTTTNITKTADFYKLLGFEFPEFKSDEQHLEAKPREGSAKLMIDSKEIVMQITHERPHPGNHSAFAIQYDTGAEVDQVVENVKAKGFDVIREPWDAFWGQRYAVVSDPDGYHVDLYAQL